MKHKKILVALCLGLILLLSAVIYFGRNTSMLPLDTEYATDICFFHYPQYEGNYSVTDDASVQEIMRAINSLNMQDGTKRAEKMSENYYYFAIHLLKKDISVELDENIISVNNENYQADTSVLRTLLEQTIRDVKLGEIE